MTAYFFLQISPTIQDQLLSSALWWIIVLWLAAAGGCVGSFLTVVWDRRGTDRGIVYPASQCEECGHAIRWYHNIPILGWLMLKGRCHDCGTKIPVKHLSGEIIFAVLFVLVGLLSPWL